MRHSASSLKAEASCSYQRWLKSQGYAEEINSRAVAGTVFHYAAQLLVRYGSLERAEEAIRHYWHPTHINELYPGGPITKWVGKGRYQDSYGTVLQRLLTGIRDLDELLRDDPGETLATELEFEVPVGSMGDTVSGMIDRLSFRYAGFKPLLILSDYKTGRRNTYLRWNLQGTTYAFATTHPLFWDAFGPRADDMRARFLQPDVERRFEWIDINSAKLVDGGERNERDYRKLHLACDMRHKAREVNAFTLNLSGEACEWCSFRETVCGTVIPQVSGDHRHTSNT